MTERWHRTRDLAGLPGMPGTRQKLNHFGPSRGWISRRVSSHKQALEWLESSLPPETQAALRGEALPTVDSDSDAGLPAAVPVLGTGPVARLDARVELVAAFELWRGRRAVVPALREWASIYKETGCGVSEETRTSIPTVHWSTLQRWRHMLRERGSQALMPKRGGRRSEIDSDPALAVYIEARLRENPHHVTARHIQEAVKAELGRELGIDAIRRWARAWRREHAFELSATAAPDAHRSRTMPAFGSAAAAITMLNQLLEIDSTIVDVMCSDGRRYHLIAAIDVWSRRAMVLLTAQSRAEAIAALIRRCLLAWGVPEWIRTDEGKDYVSKHLRRVLADLRVGHDILPPYRPDLKPFIERFIGTLARDLFARLPGFSGHNVAQAQALRERRSFAARRGEDAIATFRADLTAEELQSRIDVWCDAVYARRSHAGLGGQSPFEQAASWTGLVRRIENERALDALLAPAAGDGRRKINKNGIHVDGGEYIAAELGDHMDAWVHVRQDPADYGRIWVFAEPGPGEDVQDFICIAQDPARTGIDRQAVATEARRRWRAKSTAGRKRSRELAREHPPATDAVLGAAAAEAERVVALPRRGEVHRTDALEAAAKAEQAAARAARAERDEAAGRPASDIALIQHLWGESS